MTVSSNEHVGAALLRLEVRITAGMQAFKALVRRAAVALPVIERMIRARRLRRHLQAAFGYVPNLRSPMTYNEKLG